MASTGHVRCVAVLAVAGGLTVAGLVGATGALAQSAKVEPKGKLTLAWHTNITARWLDPQHHDGTATPDNFLMALHDALIKNFRDKLFDQPALAERYEFAEDAKSATFWLRPGIKFHDGSPITSADVKYSFEHYRGAWADVLHKNTESVAIVNDHTVRFQFKEPFLDFPALLGTANVSGAGWVVPAKYYEAVGQSGFLQKPIGAGPYKLASQEAGTRLEIGRVIFEPLDQFRRLNGFCYVAHELRFFGVAVQARSVCEQVSDGHVRAM